MSNIKYWEKGNKNLDSFEELSSYIEHLSICREEKKNDRRKEMGKDVK